MAATRPYRRRRPALRAASAALLGVFGALVLVTAVPGAGGMQSRASVATAAVRPLRIMPLGDSITWGTGSTTGDGYRAPLWQHLTAAGVAVNFVGSRRAGAGLDPDNEGHYGWRIRQIAAHVRPWVMAARPDVVLLDIGTNDCWQADDLAHAANRLLRLIRTILASSPTVRVVVARLQVAPRDTVLAAREVVFNRRVAAVVAAAGRRTSMVDMSTVSAADTVDGVHPNDRGYRQMSYYWYEALRRVAAGGPRWPTIPYPV